MRWTEVTGKQADNYNFEEGWTLLPDGTVLTVDIWYNGDFTLSERFNPATQTWSSAGSTIAHLADNSGEGATNEIGPALLRPNGTVFYFGSNHSGVAHTAIFDTSSSTVE